MCSLNIRGLYVSRTMTSGVVSRCPVSLLALDYPPDLQYCSHVREPDDVGHSRPIHDGTAYDIDMLITILESNSYHIVPNNFSAAPAPRRAHGAATKCDVASILPKAPQTPMNTGCKPVDMTLFHYKTSRQPPRVSRRLRRPTIIYAIDNRVVT